MPLVNLINEQRVLVKQRERQVGMLWLGTLAILAASFLVALTLFVGSIALNVESFAVEDQIRKLEPIRAKVEENEAAIQQLDPRIRTLEDAETATKRWNELLNFVRFMPRGVQLTAMRATAGQPTDPVVVQFSGYGPDQASVGAFLARLNASEELEKVEFVFSRESTTEKGRRIDFEMKGQIKGTAAPEPVKTEKEAS